MKLISCDHCGIVLDKNKIHAPYISDKEDNKKMIKTITDGISFLGKD